MSQEKKENIANDNPNQSSQPNPPIIINNQYIKDLSLEIPHAPEIFRQLKDNPDINIDVNVNANHMHDNFFNVSLLFKINGIVDNQPFFILEMEYAGVVNLNVPEEHVEPILLIEIPLQNAGLPPLMLNPIDFAAMYQHKKQSN